MTTKKKHLRAAEEGEAPPKPKTLAQAIQGDSYLDILLAQRRQMVVDLADAKGPALAALHRQIALHSKEIAALQAAAKTEADEGAESAQDEAFTAEAL